MAPEHDRLAKMVREEGGYDLVEVGYDHGQEPSIERAVEAVIAGGATRVVVVPVGMMNAGLSEVIRSVGQRHPEVEVVNGRQPTDVGHYASWIVSKVREHDPAYADTEAAFGLARLGSVKTGDTAVIHDFDAGHTLVSRLSALGFTPGASVTMIQNYGHGPVIVSVRDTRIALGRGEASRIRVRRVACGE
jgi:ferrous iron transport protein A